MGNKLCIFICNSLVVEATHIIKKLNFHDVVLKSYPTTCIARSVNPIDIIENSGINTDDFSKIIFFVSSCYGSKKSFISENKKIEIFYLNQCFELLIGSEILNYFIKSGYYIVSNGWLANYKKYIQNWGFDNKTAQVFFGESMKKILFLDTGLKWNYRQRLANLSAYMGLEWESFPIGLSYAHNLLNQIISEWRINQQNSLINEKLASVSRENADYLLVFFMLNKLVNYTDEKVIIQEIFNLINMLFSPENIVYQKFNNNVEIESFVYNNDNKTNTEKAEVVYKINYQNETSGQFQIYNVKFPEFIDKYNKIGEVISQISGLAIANAEKFKIVENQKLLLELQSKDLLEANLSKDKFFSIIAHDLKSPFNSFLGLTRIMAEDIQSLTMMQLQNITKRLEKSAESLYNLLENLLQWARMQQGLLPFNPQLYHLKSEITKNLEIITDTAHNKLITINTQIDEHIFINVDINMFNTIIRNLVQNAIKFSYANSEINIFTNISEDKHVEINIKDQGIGMNKNIQEKLFKIDGDIGRKGTDGEPSTGLGLLICKDFVEKNKGYIKVISIEGEGSNFIINLPLSAKH